MKNSQRNYNNLIKEICKEEKIDVETYSGDWIFRLKKGSKYRHILGYRFELNTSVSEHICNDKSATYEILSAIEIPCVEHFFFFSPDNLKYLNKAGNWAEMVRIFKKNNNKIVCKPNEGTGGKDVYFIDNQIMLENVVQKMFLSNRSITLSPFYEIKNEYRIIVLDGEIKLMYKKIIPYVIGDGVSTVIKLLSITDEKYNLSELGEFIKYYDVPLKGELVRLNWKHNLGQGASAEEINNSEIISKLSDLAIKTVNILNIRFASVDIIETEEGKIKVLEVNSGVMMDYYSKMSDKNYEIAKRIYKDAIIKMF